VKKKIKVKFHCLFKIFLIVEEGISVNIVILIKEKRNEKRIKAIQNKKQIKKEYDKR
jgi:hypothetical protein